MISECIHYEDKGNNYHFCKSRNMYVDRVECNPDCARLKIRPVGMLGWTCPVCGTGCSPFVTYCPCKRNNG